MGTKNTYARNLSWFNYRNNIVEMSLVLSSNTVNASAKENTATINVTSTNDWTISSEADWLTAKKENGTILLTILANPMAATRTATIKVTSDGTTDQVITVSQEAGTTGLTQVDNSVPSIFPNPVSSLLHINGNDQFTSVSIFDLNGKRVVSTAISENQVDVSKLSNGIYTIRLEGRNGSFTGKFLKK